MNSPAGSRKTAASSVQTEVVLLPSLKNCLLNLPSSLVSLLLNANTVAQDVVVELGYRTSAIQNPDGKHKPPSVPRSVFLGWTGLPSQTRLASVVGKGGIAGSGRDGRGQSEHDIPTVEIDATFGRLLGLAEGMKVNVSIHLDPPQAHTVNIEPLTATDWEIIELHAHFLEMNFLSQVRALPNPAAGHSHPLTLHLTPTSTANILVTSLTPTPKSDQGFVKISPDAEVIVAPKSRQSTRPDVAKDSRSVTSTSRRSESGRSTKSDARARSHRDDARSRPPIFLRGVTRSLQSEWFESASEDMKDDGLKVWLDPEHLLSRTLRGVTWAVVSIVRAVGLEEPVDLQNQPSPDSLPAAKIVARLCAWEDAPDARHVALSSMLCAVLGAEKLVGGIVRIDPAPSPLPRTPSALKEPSQQASKDAIVKKLRITPFAYAVPANNRDGFKFGNESKSERAEAAQHIRMLFGKSILDGPLTDGMMLPPRPGGWPGGILDFEPSPAGDPSRVKTNWLLGGDRKLEIVVQPETARPKLARPPGEELGEPEPVLVGIEALVEQIRSSLIYSSSVLLTGGIGAGKTSLAQLLAYQLQREYLYHVIYFPCRSAVTDETRVKVVKETLNRIFAAAAWGARMGGRSLVILDDVDKLCPVETELQVDANGRSHQISDLLCSTVRQYCGRDSGVVLLVTAQSKEAVNNVLIGGHIVRDILAIKAPSKAGRRQVLELFVHNRSLSARSSRGHEAPPPSADSNAWMEGSDDSRPTSANGAEHVAVDPALDLLDVAAQTDGYMPGDLALLISRARSEALIRAVSESAVSGEVTLGAEDFAAALKGFTPASLRGVSLHSSSTTFASIGGLKETRRILLETLQYPTTYAPLFAKCPLRLRSGLLLYGYPGCGKTLLASAVAGECGLNFISVKGPEILNKYIGASEKSVRDLFERAEAAKPCILFFDEFDAIAPKRGHDSTGVTDRVVNMLLTMMDGAEGLTGVYILAATSRPDLIDPALLRPGRLDKSLLCDMPNAEDRLDILQAVSTKLHVEASVLNHRGSHTLDEVAARTQGYSGADLQAVMYNAHLEAIHDVLGSDAKAGTPDLGKRKRPSRGGNGVHDFTYFRLDESENAGDRALAPAALAAERAQIAAQLSTLQLTKRKAKQERHAVHGRRTSFNHQQANGTTGAPYESAATPIITWHHLVKSLETTRSSISAQERQRLERIYREFVVGRNGDMSDGQGGTDIGGRTTLM